MPSNFKIPTTYRILFFAIFILGASTVNSQDLIVLQNGNEVPAKVLEITTNEIKYKLVANPDGPVYVLSKSEIFMIKYESGVKEVFNKSTTPSPQPAPAPTPQAPAPSYSYNSTPAQTVKAPPSNYRTTKRHYISLTPLGLGMPFGRYSSTDTTGGSVNSGFATVGYSGNIEGAYFPHPNIGICAQFGLTTNGVNDSQTQTLLRNSGGNWTFNTGAWVSAYIMAGPIASVPLSGSSFDFKFLVGYVNVNSPTYDYKGTSRSGDYLNYSQSSANAESLLLMPGINYRLLLSEKIGFKFSLDLMLSTNSLQFNTTETISSNLPSIGTQSFSYSYTVPVNNVNLGIGFFVGLWK
ncbi:MAG: hypothetical protein K2Q22_14980 [Cytophagales bacterium]|nr:hypothetical protein [Cytophagales bacterium]